jgi:hypothetical protein
MDLNSLELAANIVFRMCREHPEICPHDYQFRYSIQHENGSVTKCYRCQICGIDFAEVVPPLDTKVDI